MFTIKESKNDKMVDMTDRQTFVLEGLCSTHPDSDPIEVTGKNSKYKGRVGIATRYTKCWAYVTLVDEDGFKKETHLSKRNVRKLKSTASNHEEAVLEALPEIGQLLARLADVLASAGLTESPIVEGLLRAELVNAANDKKKTKGPYYIIADPNAMVTTTAAADPNAMVTTTAAAGDDADL
jgi:phosphopantothenoylcysteine synthetase/decarboxylase